MTDVLSKLRQAKTRADGEEDTRRNFAAYVADRVEFGGWTDEDVAEYREEVRRIFKSGTEDEKAAAREFWQHKLAPTPQAGINQRIRDRIAAEQLEAA